MNRLPTIPAMVLAVALFSFIPNSSIPIRTVTKTVAPKIQAAILLDVSNSMDGLIDQAKNQLWNMVNVLSKVTCEGTTPSIEIALYEYGKDSNDPNDGYIKQITAFTNNLDSLFKKLISLATLGGQEYCGHVMFNSLTQLNWENGVNNYKVIFIAGNESFLQGSVSYTKACDEARKKGVIVNTIYCGGRADGIKEHWDLGAECGSGSFTNIDQDAKPLSIPTPYDSMIITLKRKMNSTYIGYGEHRALNYEYIRADSIAVYNLNDPTKIASYMAVKANGGLDFNFHPDWDLVDAYRLNPKILDSVDMNTIADTIRPALRRDLRKVVELKATERQKIQDEIAELSLKQEKYIMDEKKKLKNNEPKTLESEIERIIREQVTRVNMKIK
jgi:hypothetical protein